MCSWCVPHHCWKVEELPCCKLFLYVFLEHIEITRPPFIGRSKPSSLQFVINMSMEHCVLLFMMHTTQNLRNNILASIQLIVYV